MGAMARLPSRRPLPSAVRPERASRRPHSRGRSSTGAASNKGAHRITPSVRVRALHRRGDVFAGAGRSRGAAVAQAARYFGHGLFTCPAGKEATISAPRPPHSPTPLPAIPTPSQPPSPRAAARSLPCSTSRRLAKPSRCARRIRSPPCRRGAALWIPGRCDRRQ